MPGASVCSQCGSLPVGLATSDAVTERRVVTILFGDLTSWSEDLDPERVGVVTDRVMESLVARSAR